MSYPVLSALCFIIMVCSSLTMGLDIIVLCQWSSAIQNPMATGSELQRHMSFSENIQVVLEFWYPHTRESW